MLLVEADWLFSKYNGNDWKDSIIVVDLGVVSPKLQLFRFLRFPRLLLVLIFREKVLQKKDLSDL